MKRWTEIEVDFLKEFYPIYGQEYCANILNRTIGSIRTKATNCIIILGENNDN